MQKKLTMLVAAGAVVLGAMASSAGTAGAAGKVKRPAYGLTRDDSLVGFDATNPSRARKVGRVTGVAAGETLLGIDFRPFTGLLYTLGDRSNVYAIDPGQSPQATLVSSLRTASGAGIVLSGTRFGIDFNPAADRLRVISDAGQNLRADVDTGVTTVDGTLTYAVGDRNAGARPVAVGAAYTNNDNDSLIDPPLVPFGRVATGTKLYTIDSARDLLGLQDPPSDGTLATVGRLRRRATAAVGFDVYSVQNSEGNVAGNIAYASLRRGGRARLYKVGLSTGRARLVRGGAGAFRAVEDIAIRP